MFLAEEIVYHIYISDVRNSSVGVKDPQAFADEQIAVYDCHERLVNYKYISVTDVDEFFILHKDDTLQALFVSIYQREERMT